MAESHHDKTEQPTYRKQQKARSKGQVVKSNELQSALMILSGVLALKFLAPWMNVQLLEKFVESLATVGDTAVSAESIPGFAAAWVEWGATLLAPMFVLIALAGITSALLIQGGLVFSTDALSPNLERLNPIAGMQRLFSGRMLFNLFRDVLKILLIGLVCYHGVKEAIFLIVNRADIALSAAVSQVGNVATSLAFKAGGVLLVIGLMDYAYQRRQYIQDLKMTKKEVKDEVKESEGDPFIKGRIRSQQKELARRRMMMAVPTADVVLTNPTQIAVALKYDAETMTAPKVVAKGQRLIAERIKEIAREFKVPVIEDKPLARSLFKLAPVGGEIPVDLYRAVAEVLSYVYKLKGKKPLQGD